MTFDLSVRVNGKDFRVGGAGEGKSITFWMVDPTVGVERYERDALKTFHSFGELLAFLNTL